MSERKPLNPRVRLSEGLNCSSSKPPVRSRTISNSVAPMRPGACTSYQVRIGGTGWVGGPDREEAARNFLRIAAQ